jgi:hypothetical protein
MTANLCDVCNKNEAIGVASTSVPLSVAFCVECARRGADPEIVFLYWAEEGIRPEIHACPDYATTYKDGKYVTYREWFEARQGENL